MLFTTAHWLVFLLTVFLAYHLVPRRFRRWVMLASSVYFYASWSVPYLGLIAAHLLMDWGCGLLLGRPDLAPWRRWVMTASVGFNLGSLVLFKYYGFIAGSLLAIGLALPELTLTLPLGISFFAFESLSYTIDVYRGRLVPFRSPLRLALFVTWFPHLIAGPIIRPSEMAPQLEDRPPVDRARFLSGLQLMLQG